jgi:hypothetical protein
MSIANFWVSKVKLDKRYLTAFFLGLFLAVFIHLPGYLLTIAATKNFTQTDWVGGGSTAVTVSENAQTGFNRYYSATAGINTTTPNTIQLNLVVQEN